MNCNCLQENSNISECQFELKSHWKKILVVLIGILIKNVLYIILVKTTIILIDNQNFVVHSFLIRNFPQFISNISY